MIQQYMDRMIYKDSLDNLALSFCRLDSSLFRDQGEGLPSLL